ncbi:energy-coupling factor transporter transmembrane component T family protein [Paenarthrobacter sp. PH39-S1]|uniref:energy-coupling factor transporter transmembrane component T family protein n=1 Tax=Micrococcaceae TaxID=1268 RepID=UPI0024BA7C78|nr:energy-coupling factor transporter transmembrane protein EcfT [Paenarthrobacter sp. PH39-S1]MDJ0356712.1 energy-coupling factor transporter transmembrane protein EcfT [Paenarthrobacter sp. PH39-S1]
MRGHAHLIAGYVPGTSWLHRSPLWLKAVLLLIVTVLCFATGDVYVTTAVLAAVVVLHFVAGLPPGRLWRPVRLMLVFLLLIGAYQYWQSGPLTAWRVVAGILAAVLASNALTATTTVAALLDGLVKAVRPLRRFGADPERFALTVSLMLRSIPFIIGAFDDVRDAARARGLERNLRARTLPVLIGTVAYARATGEALAARGLGDAEDRRVGGAGD